MIIIIKMDIYLMLISCRRRHLYLIHLDFNNNINNNSNRKIIPWQITIHFTFYSRMYACFSMLLKQIHTVHLFFRKKNSERNEYVIFFYLKNV